MWKQTSLFWIAALVISLLAFSLVGAGCGIDGGAKPSIDAKEGQSSGDVLKAPDEGASSAEPDSGITPGSKRGSQPGTGHDRALLAEEAIQLQGVGTWVERLKARPGVYTSVFGSYRVFLISMGERPTAGYTVEVSDISKRDGQWVLEVVFRKPGPKDVVAEVLSYPHAVVAVPDDGLKVVVRELGGPSQQRSEDLPIIPYPPEGPSGYVEESENIVIEIPQPGQEVKSPILIKGWARVFEGSLIVVIEDGHNELFRGPVQASSGVGWGTFEVEVDYEKPTSPHGAVIIYSEDPRDGSIAERVIVPVSFADYAN